MRVIENCSFFIKNIFGDNLISVIEFGPGDKNAIRSKTIPILRNIDNLHSFTSIDINPIYAQEASELILHSFPTIQSSSIEGDFLTSNLQKKAHLILLLGGTIHNFSQEDIDKLFKCFHENIYDNGYVLLTIDTNHDPISLKEAYDHPYSHALAKSCLAFLKKKCSLDLFNDKAFESQYKWCPETSEVKLFLQAQQPQFFNLNGCEIMIKENDRFHVFSSKKFRDQDICNLAESHKFKVVNFFNELEKRIKIYLLQKLTSE